MVKSKSKQGKMAFWDAYKQEVNYVFAKGFLYKFSSCKLK